jgi:hypothetical protein
MSKYNKPYLINKSGVPNAHYLKYKWRERKTDRFIFNYGTWVKPDDFDLIFHSSTTLEKQTQYDCIPNNAAVLLVNERALKILEDLSPNDFQSFEATIVSEEDNQPAFKVYNYRLINITKLVDAIDINKSECCRFDTGEIYGVEKLVLKENCMGNIHLARDQSLHSHILASDTLRKAFTKAKIRGVKFLRDDQW